MRFLCEVNPEKILFFIISGNYLAGLYKWAETSFKMFCLGKEP